MDASNTNASNEGAATREQELEHSLSDTTPHSLDPVCKTEHMKSKEEKEALIAASTDTAFLLQAAAQQQQKPDSDQGGIDATSGLFVRKQHDDKDGTVVTTDDPSASIPSLAKNSNRRSQPSACKETVAPPALGSYATQKLPALPDEQDRKRFVGCLAAVLAASYDYDEIGDESTNQSTNESTQEQLYAMTYLDEEETRDHRRKGNAEGEQQPKSGKSHSGAQSEPLSNKVASRGVEASDSSTNARSKPSSVVTASQSPSYREDNAEAMARSRHRKRRYDVSAQLLLASADYFQIERGQAKAFLPLLTKLLDPKTKKKSDKVTSDMEVKPIDISTLVDEVPNLRAFWESLSPGAGFRCLALFLLQHLLKSEAGYDARVRRAMKKVGVLVLLHDMEIEQKLRTGATSDQRAGKTTEESEVAVQKNQQLVIWMKAATRKFEALEHCLAVKLVELWQLQKQHAKLSESGKKKERASGKTTDQLYHGLQIGGAAVLAGTLFAVTGGMAAPGIAAAFATLAGTSAMTASAVALLGNVTAMTALFGVGGGSLAAYKMQRRVQGLTEFEFHKEKNDINDTSTEGQKTSESKDQDIDGTELFSTICLSGWLRDKHDFQRPWGVVPTQPRLEDRVELLERFYAVYKPEYIPRSKKLLAHWKDKEDHLWQLLKQKYGRDPDHLFPLSSNAHLDRTSEEAKAPSSPADYEQQKIRSLTVQEMEVLAQQLVELGYTPAPTPENQSPTPAEPSKATSPMERMRLGLGMGSRQQKGSDGGRTTNTASSASVAKAHDAAKLTPSSVLPDQYFEEVDPLGADGSSVASSSLSTSSVSVQNSAVSTTNNEDGSTSSEVKIPKHVTTVWDYHVEYGGELYTVKWESELLTGLSDSVTDLAYNLVVSKGKSEILKHTILAGLLASVALPATLVKAADFIDGSWDLSTERADAAGQELARSLLHSCAGQRPVTLIGFSFGARAVYSCLKELAKLQEQWEIEQKMAQKGELKGGKKSENGKSSDTIPREPASIVEDVVLMGLPNHLCVSSWKACRRVVAGRLVHCYSQKDLILSWFHFRRLGLTAVCGTTQVDVPGVENFDVSDIIAGHQDYCLRVRDVLRRVQHGEPYNCSW